MDKQAWADGLRNLWRQWSMQFAVVYSAALGYYLSLPPSCTGEGCTSQASLLAHLPVPAWSLPFLLGLLPQLLLRAAPQAPKTPNPQEDPKP